MAIYHFSVKTISRSAGYSAVAAAAYRSGEKLTDDRTGETHDYRTRGGVESVTLHLPPGVPGMARAELWNKAEIAEKRINSTVAREFEVSLPNELSKETKIKLANELGQHLSDKYCCAVDVAVHKPTAKNNDKNDHAHLLMSTRDINKDGEFGAKTRILDAAKTGAVEIKVWRKYWADICNRELALAGFSERIDHRSFKDQGLEKLPTIHHGNGPKTARIKAQNADIQELNGINAQLADLLKERAAIAAAEDIEQATSQAVQDAAKALEHAEKIDPVAVLAVANQDVAGTALTPVEIAVLRQELANPALTLPDMEIQLKDINNAAHEAAQIIAKANAEHTRASPQKYVFEARAALPEAVLKLETAKANFETLEAKGLPWWAPWRRPALARAQDAYNATKTQVNDLKYEARAPVLEEVEEAARKARKQLAAAQAERERIEMQMPQKNPLEPAQNAVTALLMGDAARAKAAADKIKNK